jgi:hypothetical protein
MTPLEQFEQKYFNSKVRDGQCVALLRQYWEEVYGIPHTGSVEGAYDLWTTYETNPKLQQYFQKIEGRPTSGDAAIFSPIKTNQYGHIALVVSAEDSWMNVFEQDGINAQYAHPNKWTWERYVGALRPRGNPIV